MIKIEKLNNGFKVEGIDNVLYPDNGTLVFGANTVILVTDESDMVTFRSASNFDVLFSGLLENITIDGESVTKDNIVTKFQAVANVEPASKEDIDDKVEEIEGEIGNLSDEVALKANATDLLTLFDGAEYNSQTKKIVFKHGDTVLVQIDATDFIKDGMVSNVEIVDNKLVISFNTDAGKENIEIPLSEIFNPNDYYTKTQIDAKEQSVNASIALKANITDLNAETTARQEKDTTLQNGLDSLALNLANEINNRQDADTALQSNIDAKANAEDVYDKQTANSTFATQTVVNEEIAARIQRDSEIEQSLVSKADKSDTYSKSEVDDALATKQNVGDYATNTALTDGLALKADKSDTYTKQEVDDAIANVDVSDQLVNYETIANHNADKALLEASIALKANSADLATVATSGSYDDLSDKPTIPTVPTNVSAFTNDAGYLTEHQSLSDYYTKSEVDTELADKQDKLTAGTNITIDANNVISSTGGTQVQADWNQTDDTAVDYIKNKPVFPDTSEFVTKEEYNPKEVAIAEALTELNENKADKTELPDVSTFATKTELNAKQDALVSGTNIKTINNQSILGEGNIEIQGGGGGTQQQADWNQTDTTAVDYIKNKPTNVSAFTNDAGYLTQHQSLADYYTKTEIDAMIGNINTILASI